MSQPKIRGRLSVSSPSITPVRSKVGAAGLALAAVLASACSDNNDSSDSGPHDGGAGSVAGGAGGNGSGSSGGSGSGGTSGGDVDVIPGTPDKNTGPGVTPAAFKDCALSGKVTDLGNPWMTEDNNGPNSHSAMYGARPRLVAAPRGDGSFDVAWQTAPGADKVFISHVEKSGDVYAAQWHLQAVSLGQLGGLAVASNGDVVLVTAASEDLQTSATPEKTHRDGILQLVRIDSSCAEVYRSELRTDFDGNTDRLPVYSPYTAGTSRLALSDTGYAVLFSQNTEYDASINSRHQTGRYIAGTLDNGAVTQVVAGISHSFMQRLHAADDSFVSLELGDASLRGIGMGWLSDGTFKRRTIFTVKGGDSTTGGGYNNTFTRLADVLPAKDGFVAAFATEAGSETAARVNVSRNLAWVHAPQNFSSIEQPEQYTVVATDTKVGNDGTVDWDVAIKDYWGSSAVGKNKQVAWLTNYDDAASAHVEKPKLVRFSDQAFYLIWEKWELESYTSTWAMMVDEYGNVLRSAVDLGSVRLPRGDDAFLVDGQAAWVEGSIDGLVLHRVDTDLKHVKDVL